MSLSSPSFFRLVQALKAQKKTLTVVESCCGGLINASIMAVPNSSKVYYGGCIAYNTRRAKPLLLNNDELHAKLMTNSSKDTSTENEADRYVESKLHWTRETAVAFCHQLDTDYAIAEGGAAGPTFRPEGLDRGFAVIAIAARDDKDGSISVVKQEVVRSTHADRIKNMRLFADRAAELTLDVVTADNIDATFSGSEDTKEPNQQRHLDRATHLRSDPEKLEAMAKDGRYVVLHDNEALCWEGWELAKLSQAQVHNICKSLEIEPVRTFLGLLDGKEAVFGVDVYTSHDDLERVRAAGTACSGGAKFENTRTGAPLMSPIHNEMVLHATALAQWQRRAPYCSACGSTTRLIDGGTCRECSGCGQKTWPRQDPSMIAAITSRDKERILLARSPRHPSGMFTALAGFVEAGETFEKAVAREVYEETGIRIDEDSVKYIGSQPWPFPQSIMIGFSATADETQTLNLDKDELVEAGWFERDQVGKAGAVPGPVMRKEVAEEAFRLDPSLDLLIPPKGVLARTLIDTWLDRRV